MSDKSFLQATNKEVLRYFTSTIQEVLFSYDLQFCTQNERFYISNFMVSLENADAVIFAVQKLLIRFCKHLEK